VPGLAVDRQVIAGPYGLVRRRRASRWSNATVPAGGSAFLLPAVFGDPDAGWRRVATHPVLLWLGRVSPRIFLWQVLVITLVRRALGLAVFGSGFWITLGAAVVLSVAAAAASCTWSTALQRARRALPSAPFAARAARLRGRGRAASADRPPPAAGASPAGAHPGGPQVGVG
jgi:peptidoglycan/LPS O-acetylase OafA/YrhL